MTSHRSLFLATAGFTIAALVLIASVAGISSGRTASASPTLWEMKLDDATYRAEVARLRQQPGGLSLPDAAPVSLERYRGAMQDSIACMSREFRQRAGAANLKATFEAAAPTASADQFDLSTTYTVHTAQLTNPADVVAANALIGPIELQCRSSELDVTEQRYHLDQLHSDTYIRSVSQGFVSCLRKAGIAVGTDDQARDLLHRVRIATSSADPTAAQTCVADYPSVNTAVPS